MKRTKRLERLRLEVLTVRQLDIATNTIAGGATRFSVADTKYFTCSCNGPCHPTGSAICTN